MKAHNAYDEINLSFDKEIARYAQLRAEYVVEQEAKNQLQNVHDKCKLGLFPELRWLVGNFMPFEEHMDSETALKQAIKAW